MIDVSIAAAGFCLLILMMALGFYVAVAMFAISIAGAGCVRERHSRP